MIDLQFEFNLIVVSNCQLPEWGSVPNPHVECGAILIKENQFSVFYIFVIIELRLIISNGLFLKKITFHHTVDFDPKSSIFELYQIELCKVSFNSIFNVDFRNIWFSNIQSHPRSVEVKKGQKSTLSDWAG